MVSAKFCFEPLQRATVAIKNSDLLFPVNRVFCVGRNYVEHAKEMGHTGKEPPFFFLKPASTVVNVPVGTVKEIHYPMATSKLDYEAELVLAIHKGGRQITNGREHIYGFATGLDMTRRDLQAEAKKLGRPWCSAKGFDESCPISPITLIGDFGDKIEDSQIQLHLNGEVKQSSTISMMIYNCSEIVEHISQLWELQPGDLIMTGTPAGVGPVGKGDTVKVEITGLSEL
jgi:fumarylpyruvate hydrolase